MEEGKAPLAATMRPRAIVEEADVQMELRKSGYHAVSTGLAKCGPKTLLWVDRCCNQNHRASFKFLLRQENFNPLNEWVQRFKDHHEIAYKATSGQIGTLDDATIQ